MHEAATGQRITQSQPPLPAQWSEFYKEDEISLVDLWLVLVKRKRLVWGIFVLSILLGLAAAFMLTKKYAYTTAIEIGTTAVGA